MNTKLEVIRMSNEDVISTSVSNDCDKVYGFIEVGEGWNIYYNNSWKQDQIEYTGNPSVDKYYDYQDNNYFYHINNKGEVIGTCKHNGNLEAAREAHGCLS